MGLTPMAPDGAEDVIVAVDPYSKWVELGRLPKLNSHETAQFFHSEIVCRYGVPRAVRSDRGTEYAGRF